MPQYLQRYKVTINDLHYYLIKISMAAKMKLILINYANEWSLSLKFIIKTSCAFFFFFYTMLKNIWSQLKCESSRYLSRNWKSNSAKSDSSKFQRERAYLFFFFFFPAEWERAYLGSWDEEGKTKIKFNCSAADISKLHKTDIRLRIKVYMIVCLNP